MEEKKPPVKVVVKVKEHWIDTREILKTVKQLEAMQKECSCHCTLIVEEN